MRRTLDEDPLHRHVEDECLGSCVQIDARNGVNEAKSPWSWKAPALHVQAFPSIHRRNPVRPRPGSSPVASWSPMTHPVTRTGICTTTASSEKSWPCQPPPARASPGRSCRRSRDETAATARILVADGDLIGSGRHAPGQQLWLRHVCVGSRSAITVEEKSGVEVLQERPSLPGRWRVRMRRSPRTRRSSRFPTFASRWRRECRSDDSARRPRARGSWFDSVRTPVGLSAPRRGIAIAPMTPTRIVTTMARSASRGRPRGRASPVRSRRGVCKTPNTPPTAGAAACPSSTRPSRMRMMRPAERPRHRRTSPSRSSVLLRATV